MLDCTASIGWITMATLIPTASNVALVTGLSQKKDMPLLHLKERNTHLWAATKTILMQQIPVMIRVKEYALRFIVWLTSRLPLSPCSTAAKEVPFNAHSIGAPEQFSRGHEATPPGVTALLS